MFFCDEVWIFMVLMLSLVGNKERISCILLLCVEDWIFVGLYVIESGFLCCMWYILNFLKCMYRLLVLFPKIDVEPDDGYVSEHELTEWNLKQSEKEVMHRTKREMDVHDKNHDGFVSFAEYEPPSWVRNSGKCPCSSLVMHFYMYRCLCEHSYVFELYI